MRIAINALSVQGGGGLTLLKNLLKNLPLVGPENRYVVLGTETQMALMGIHRNNSNIEAIICSARGWVARACWEQMIMPRVLRGEKVDILYAPGNQGLVLFSFPFVVVIQNVDPLTGELNRTSLNFRLKQRALRIMMHASVHRARKVIAISEYTRHLVVREFGCDSRKIEVVPHGCPEDASLLGLEKTQDWPGKCMIEGPYVLAVSNIKYNKNYETLIEAFAIASRVIWGPINLVVAGEVEHRRCFSRLKYLVEQQGITGRVQFVGGVDHEVLRSLYAGAQALVFPSRVESFGLPPLEAMAYGVPVSASSIDAVVEVCGDAVLYFGPHNSGEMAEAIVRVVTDDTLRSTLVGRGLARAKRFNWEETARRTLKVLEAAVSG